MDLREKLLEEIDRHLMMIPSLEDGSKEQAIAVEDLTKLVNQINQLQATEWEYFDKQERRDLDKAKNEAMLEIEKKKSDITWQRVLFEIGGKVVLPAALTLVGYNVFQKRILKFEETGRLVTSASRELHLPKIWFLK